MLTALTSNDITKVGIGSTVVLVVIGLVLLMLVGALVARVLIVIVVVALAVLVWQQRAVIENHVKKCELSMSFFGFHINAPDSVKQQCQKTQG